MQPIDVHKVLRSQGGSWNGENSSVHTLWVILGPLVASAD